MCRPLKLRTQSATTLSTPPGLWALCRPRVRAPFRPPILRSKFLRRRSRTGRRGCPASTRRRSWPCRRPLVGELPLCAETITKTSRRLFLLTMTMMMKTRQPIFEDENKNKNWWSADT